MCVPGKTCGAIGFALTFWLHLLRQGKRWKEEYCTLKRILQKQEIASMTRKDETTRVGDCLAIHNNL